MNKNAINQEICCCQNNITIAIPVSSSNKLVSKTKTTVQTISSSLLSLIVAFFPKCPVCWAAYMSMFGSFGLTKIPYFKWMLPILIIFLGIHLLFILKKVRQKGIGPFAISLIGVIVIICTRNFSPQNSNMLFMGMACILTGSLWNSFSFKKLNLSF